MPELKPRSTSPMDVIGKIARYKTWQWVSIDDEKIILDALKYQIEHQPGKWAMLNYDMAQCTRCGYIRDTPFDSTREAREHWNELPSYCEDCGAPMLRGDHDA